MLGDFRTHHAGALTEASASLTSTSGTSNEEAGIKYTFPESRPVMVRVTHKEIRATVAVHVGGISDGVTESLPSLRLLFLS